MLQEFTSRCEQINRRILDSTLALRAPMSDVLRQAISQFLAEDLRRATDNPEFKEIIAAFYLSHVTIERMRINSKKIIYEIEFARKLLLLTPRPSFVESFAGTLEPICLVWHGTDLTKTIFKDDDTAAAVAAADGWLRASIMLQSALNDYRGEGGEGGWMPHHKGKNVDSTKPVGPPTRKFPNIFAMFADFILRDSGKLYSEAEICRRLDPDGPPENVTFDRLVARGKLGILFVHKDWNMTPANMRQIIKYDPEVFRILTEREKIPLDTPILDVFNPIAQDLKGGLNPGHQSLCRVMGDLTKEYISWRILLDDGVGEKRYSLLLTKDWKWRHPTPFIRMLAIFAKPSSELTDDEINEARAGLAELDPVEVTNRETLTKLVEDVILARKGVTTTDVSEHTREEGVLNALDIIQNSGAPDGSDSGFKNKEISAYVAKERRLVVTNNIKALIETHFSRHQIAADTLKPAIVNILHTTIDSYLETYEGAMWKVLRIKLVQEAERCADLILSELVRLNISVTDDAQKVKEVVFASIAQAPNIVNSLARFAKK
jgi:hypothetical protein